MADIAKLYELQKVDTTWEKVRRRLVQIRSLLVESEELQAQRKQLAGVEAEQQKWHAEQKNAELESQSLAERITATENRLMSGQVRNPKELESLQASLDALRRQRSSIENTGVEALLQVETLHEVVEEARMALHKLETRWKAGQTELINEETKLKRAFIQFKKQREILAAALGADVLKRYEDLRQRKGGVAIAAIERNALCSACHVQIPTGIISTARTQSPNPVLCPSCGRILYAG